MHWNLTTPADFSLTQMLKRSWPFVLRPFEKTGHPERLHRVERLSTGMTVALTIAQAPAGLTIAVSERLSAPEVEEISQKVWRALRLGEDFSDYLALQRRLQPDLNISDAPRFLRSTTLFEDLIKALIISQSPPGWYDYRTAWLVDRIGDALPRNPTLHSFPQPEQLLWEQLLLKGMFGPELARNLLQLAELFHSRGAELESLPQSPLPEEALNTILEHVPDLDQSTLDLIMLITGHYAHVPASLSAYRRVFGKLHTDALADTSLKNLLRPWHPWENLAYWLGAALPDPVKGATSHVRNSIA